MGIKFTGMRPMAPLSYLIWTIPEKGNLKLPSIVPFVSEFDKREPLGFPLFQNCLRQDLRGKQYLVVRKDHRIDFVVISGFPSAREAGEKERGKKREKV